MDLEGLTRRLVSIGASEEEIKAQIERLLALYKSSEEKNRELIASTIIKEVKTSMSFTNPLLGFTKCHMKAGEAGLGSRGIGDFLIHSALLRVGEVESKFDDAGLREDIVVAIDGIHSRLGFFPFLAGFHATRAALRDVMVKGAEPLGLLVDIHLSDDSDVGMLLDFEAGVSSVGESIGVPVLSGSTLRIGGDMVIGERISGAVGAVGRIRGKFFSRRNIKDGDKVVMTMGSGGGTISATAIFYGYHDVVERAINVSDLIACEVARTELGDVVTSMTDVTNGGLRGDANEIKEITGLSIVIDKEKFRSLIDNKVLEMLEQLEIDPLGLSIDSILIFTDNDEKVVKKLKTRGIMADTIGEVRKGLKSPLNIKEGKEIKEAPVQFRESPYTPIKKVIGNKTPYSTDEIRRRLEEAMIDIEIKRNRVREILRSRGLGIRQSTHHH
jgi:hydrogenase expression/formation protein